MESLRGYLIENLQPKEIEGDEDRFELRGVNGRFTYTDVRGLVASFYGKGDAVEEKGELILKGPVNRAVRIIYEHDVNEANISLSVRDLK